jgi:hypothetical protein
MSVDLQLDNLSDAPNGVVVLPVFVTKGHIDGPWRVAPVCYLGWLDDCPDFVSDA